MMHTRHSSIILQGALCGLLVVAAALAGSARAAEDGAGLPPETGHVARAEVTTPQATTNQGTVGITQPGQPVDSLRTTKTTAPNGQAVTAPRSVFDGPQPRLVISTTLPDPGAGTRDGLGASLYEPGSGVSLTRRSFTDEFAAQNRAKLDDLVTPRGGHGHPGIGKQLAGAGKAAVLNGVIQGALGALEQ